MTASLLNTSLAAALTLITHSVLASTPAPDWSLNNCPLPVIEARKPVSLDQAIVEDLSFKGCHGAPISAYWIGPQSSKLEKRPAILYVHWYDPRTSNSNRDEFLQEAKRMAQKGVVSLLVSTFWSVPGGNYHERRWQNDYDNTIHQTQDLLQAIRLLRSLSTEVDETRIAYVGHDYGATFGAIVAGADTTIKAFALEAGTPRITEWYMYGSASGKPEGQAATAFIDSFKLLEPTAMIAKTKQPLLLQYALHDEFISSARVQEMKQAAPKNALLKTYDTTHAMDLPQVELDRVEWLSKQLHLKK